MKSILALLIFFLVALPTAALTQAGPSASLRTDGLRRYVFITFTGLQTVSRVNYTLTYDSGGITRGFEGLIRPKLRTSRTVKRQILGTCSSSKCVFHKNPTNFQLDATLTLRSGGSTNIVKTLP